jgi:hypothetical protein
MPSHADTGCCCRSALLAGATLILTSRAALTAQLGSALLLGKATHVCTTPSLWAQLGPPGGRKDGGVKALPALEVVTLGGEAMPRSMAREWAGEVRPPRAPLCVCAPVSSPLR